MGVWRRTFFIDEEMFDEEGVLVSWRWGLETRMMVFSEEGIIISEEGGFSLEEVVFRDEEDGV